MLIQVILNEILALLKFMINTKASLTLIGVLVVFSIFVINGSIVSNIPKERQAFAAANDFGTSLSDLIREKVSNIVNKSLNQTLSGITQQSNSNTSTVNQQKSMQSSSISGPNKSTNVNCTNDKCIITTCTDNNCTTTIQNSGKSAAGSALSIITTNNSSEKASYSFQEIGQSSSPGGIIKANGAAFFGSNATGKLAFLNNVVAVYHNQIDKAGNSTLTAWKWK